MKNLFAFVFVFFLGFGAFAQTNSKHVWVSGHTRCGGVRVQGYWKTKNNHTINDNFSTMPNTNPYTGKAGWILSEYEYPNSFQVTPQYDIPTSNTRTIHTGSRGGQYYINSNGNKTYVRKN